ncbi:MAG: cytochrome c biogenesis protein CcsA [Bacteroidales bacterium]|jgi:cytochrome c-type biogenesis protein CcsB|nr:cytochrome c biogenesis protein CcsA [Bacteroidales bacterium]
MKKIVSFFSSILFTGILAAIFATAIGYATFIENNYDTITAKILIYNSKWLEILFLLICLNLIGSIFKYGLINKKKWTILLFHISFIIIIAGAAITRYFGFEGTMHIREGEASNIIISEHTVLNIKAIHGGEIVEKEKEIKLSPYTANNYSEKLRINGQVIQIKNLQYLPYVTESLVIDPNGEPMLSLVTFSDGIRFNVNLNQGESQNIDGIKIGFQSNEQQNDISFFIDDTKLCFLANDTIKMSETIQTDVKMLIPGEEIEANNSKIYTLKTLTFAVNQFLMKGKTRPEYVEPQHGMTTQNALRFLISSGNRSEEMVVYNKYGEAGQPNSVELNEINITASFGSKIIELPFSIHLTEFKLERYPGSNSPSSYTSEVILKDGANKIPYRIYMNNILKYNGYRFFQSSYDTDENGTILSVNYDILGTGITYFGYFFMIIGMILTILNRNSRFRSLLRTSVKLKEERKKFFAVFVGIFVLVFSSEAQSEQNKQLRKQHISDFAELVIQNRQGRLEPVSTIASEILRKVAKKTSFNGMSPSEVFLDMQANPEKWKNIPCIKVDNAELGKILGIKGKYASLNDFISETETNVYKLNTLVANAYGKGNNARNKFDKEIINVDERINIILTVFSADFLTIFPIPNHDNYKWVSLNGLDKINDENGVVLANTITSYFSAVNSNDWTAANLLLNNLKKNQEKYGVSVMPSKTKIKFEIFYNNINIFGKLFKIFLVTGLMLLILQLITLFNTKFKFNRFKKIAFIFIIILFVAETAGLAIRWYISGHAPWSSGYESMIFISWAICFGGIIFSRHSEITLSLTTVLAGLTLLVAGMSWMSPEITNLVPVLKSYWLIVHVSVITISYGFLGIGAMLGFLSLILMILRNQHNRNRIDFTIVELVNVIQITLIIGLLMLIIGSFLGAIWANESWGRYWGWDPKETWALITIVAYAFVCHMHKIPGLKGNFQISAAALLCFGFVLMTYFGVNYYLSGLHSYAQGAPEPVSTVIYAAAVVVLVLIITAGFFEKYSSKKHYKDEFKYVSKN